MSKVVSSKSRVVSSKTQVVSGTHKEPKTLYLNVTQQAFDVMVTGEKTKEYRRVKKWIYSRIGCNDYDLIKITSGYGLHRPYFICKYEGYEVYGGDEKELKWTNGLEWLLVKGDVIISLGEIIEAGNFTPGYDQVDALSYVIHPLEAKKKGE